jgi:ureidoglycolate lyase
VTIRAAPLTAGGFRPFGKIVERPAHAAAASLPELDYWPDVAVLPGLDGPLSLGFASLRVVPMVQAALERHLRTYEALIPVGGDMVVVVGPPLHLDEPARLPGPAELRAFRVAAGQAVVFDAGVWHYAPFAVDRPLSLIVAYQAGTAASDSVVVPLQPAITIEV